MPLLGDLIHVALDKLSLTSQRVEGWLGKPCGCKERQEKLNALHRWAKSSLTHSVARAKEWLTALTNEDL